MSEELRIIMETIGQLGQAGKEAFIWWLVVKYVLHYATLCFFILVTGFVVFRIVSAVKGHHQECRIASEVALKSSVRPHLYYSNDEYDKMYDWVRKQ
jgi:hypothetical protein